MLVASAGALVSGTVLSSVLLNIQEISSHNPLDQQVTDQPFHSAVRDLPAIMPPLLRYDLEYMTCQYIRMKDNDLISKMVKHKCTLLGYAIKLPGS
jgi:hypothetical protein